MTADIEDGHSDDADEVAEFAAELAALGVAGVNLEDSRDGHLLETAVFAKKVAAVKRRNPEVFVNARVDNLWFGEQATIEAVMCRAGAYAVAGADGIFVPGLAAAEDIRRITAGLELPVNVPARPTLRAVSCGRGGRREARRRGRRRRVAG